WTGTRTPQDAVLEVPEQLCGIHGSGEFISFPDDDSTQLRLYNQVVKEDDATVVNLSWYASKADVNTVFHVYRATDPNTPTNAAARLAVLNYTSATFTDSFGPADTGEYYYYIQAMDKTDGEILGMSPETKAIIGDSQVTGGNPQTSPYLNGSLLQYGGGYAVQLIWNEINPGNNAIYHVYRSEDPDFVVDASTLLMSAGTLTTNSYTDTSVVRGKTYYYRIAGVDLTLDLLIQPSSRLTATIPASSSSYD
ncbi:MAG: hypothetical protein FWH28_05780, partial [Clostridiales bacterium]|nr:hypothetical protein [Clostridiales bacterium]